MAAKSVNGLVPGFEYPLKGSPCEVAVSQTICYYPYGVRELFPDDYALSTMDVESYFGIVLFSSDFRPIGLLAVMDDKPLEDPKFAESIHRILASRAAAELDRLRLETLLKLQQDQAPNELDSTSDPLFMIDAYGVIRNISGPVQRIFGWEPSELIGKNINMLAPEPHRSQHDEYLAKYRKTGKTKIIGMTRTFNAVRKNGELIPIELTVWPLDSQSQGEMLFAGVMRDKSVRKAKTSGENQLPDRQSELKFA